MVKDEVLFEQLADIRERLSSIETLIKERDNKCQTSTLVASTLVACLVSAISDFIMGSKWFQH